MTEAPKLSTLIVRVEDVLAVARSLNEAICMAACGIDNREQGAAIQAVSDELRERLLSAIDQLGEIREDRL